jgi:hypothetical protein
LKIEEILKSFGRKQRRRTLDRIENFTTMIGADTVYMGVFQGKDNHIIYGEVQGECDLEGILVLGEGHRPRRGARRQHPHGQADPDHPLRRSSRDAGQGPGQGLEAQKFPKQKIKNLETTDEHGSTQILIYFYPCSSVFICGFKIFRVT